MKPEEYESEENNEQEIRAALRAAFPPMDTELHRDLWPAMLRRLEEPARRIPWYDWVLAGGLAGVSVLFPRLMLLFAYHL